jgi:NAD-dependent dihydropyrimidine dehydrogenase PreA subunit
MEIEVTDVGAEMARSRNADKCVEVCPVEVHLTASVVNRSTNIADGFFENAVRRWVGNHQSGKIVRVFINL